MIVIGLISGTSYDAIEAAAADITRRRDVLEMRPLGALSVPYSDEIRARVDKAMPPAPATLEEVCALDTLIGQEFAEAGRRARDELCGGRAELICSHGQTLYHWVEGGRARGTLQLGQPAWIAEVTGLPVVSDLRAADVAAGGQGAPLVSMLDCLLLRGSDHTRAALNLGGIANVTIVGDDAIAYDTGPANALIDAAVRHVSDGRESYDRDGMRAGRGRIDRGLLKKLLDHPYFDAPPPKSTGKEVFHLPYLLDALGSDEIAPDDIIATVTALTATTVARELRRHRVREVLASGGGTCNPTLMAMTKAEAEGIAFQSTEAIGLPPLAKEAYAFALLGWLSAHSLPGNVPSCTGAARPVVLGRLTPSRKPLQVRSEQDTPRSLRIVQEQT